MAGSGARTPFALVACGYLIAGAGFGVLVPGVTQLAMGQVPPTVSGVASAILNSARQLGTATGLAVIGAIGAIATRARWNGSPLAVSGQLSRVPSGSQAQAAQAFELGYRVALAGCVVSLLIATALAAGANRRTARTPEAAHNK